MLLECSWPNDIPLVYFRMIKQGLKSNISIFNIHWHISLLVLLYQTHQSKFLLNITTASITYSFNLFPLFSNFLPALYKHYLLDEDVSFGELSDSGEGVLYDTHDRFVRLWCDDLTGYHHDLGYLCSGLHWLWHVEVHLVAVKVCIVRGRHTEVQPKGGPGEDLDTVSHHGHFMQRRLAVEDHHVIVVDMPLHLSNEDKCLEWISSKNMAFEHYHGGVYQNMNIAWPCMHKRLHKRLHKRWVLSQIPCGAFLLLRFTCNELVLVTLWRQGTTLYLAGISCKWLSSFHTYS